MAWVLLWVGAELRAPGHPNVTPGHPLDAPFYRATRRPRAMPSAPAKSSPKRGDTVRHPRRDLEAEPTHQTAGAESVIYTGRIAASRNRQVRLPRRADGRWPR
jgi:hypothetical protein